MRVGATSRSPTPAAAGVAAAAAIPAASAAGAKNFLKANIPAIPTGLPAGAIASVFDPEWFIFGQP
jgi:hypothetical protein